MKEIRVKAPKAYSVFITSGLSGFQFQMENFKIKNIFVITDENVFKLYGNFIEALGDKIRGIKVIKPGEESKSLKVLEEIYNELLNYGVNKRSCIASLGGGVVGDIAGFAASTFMRGTGLIHIPTTLIAQCVSSIGGESDINFNKNKNLIGTFYQPLFIYTDVNFLKTLNEREYRNGISEVLKYAFTCDRDLLKYVEENKKGIKEREVDKLLHIVHECIRIKSTVFEQDEKNVGSGNLLDFGYTMGSTVEGLAYPEVPHGEALSIGMSIEGLIAVKMGYIDETSYRRLCSLIRFFELPPSFENIKGEKILQLFEKDRKNISSTIKLYLPDNSGHNIIPAELKPGIILDAINEVFGIKL